VDGEIFNVADDAPVTALELLNLNGEPISEEAASRTLDDPWEGIADTSKIRRELGSPRRSPHDAPESNVAATRWEFL
jgi:hypothetical protein